MILKRGASLAIDAPAGARSLRIGGGGKLLTVPVESGQAVIDAATSRTLPVADYATEWEVVGNDGAVRLPSGPKLRVAQSLLADELREAPLTANERLLASARATLEASAASAETSLAVEGTSMEFETRADLLAFVRSLELRVARERRRPKLTMEFKL